MVGSVAMTALPRPLASWAKELAIFDPEPAVVVGEMASRIDALLGSSGAGERANEPDGYSGLARRGTYDRLLISEWLLHEEIPEEFIRRVTANEHAFLERAYARGGERRTIVLFDAGVDQLGPPRIVHLAILIAFARRTAERNALLSWGVLQEPTRLVDGAVEAAVRVLMQGRSLRRPSLDEYARWESAVSNVGADLWLVGSARIEAIASQWRASAIRLTEDRTDPDADSGVVATVLGRNSLAPRVATFRMPPAPLAIRLLRDPFKTARATPSKGHGAREVPAVDPGTNLVAAFDGRWVYARGEGGSVLSCPVPNSPASHAPGIRVLRPPAGQHVVAVGRAPALRRTVVVTVAKDELFLHFTSKRGGDVTATTRCELPPGYDERGIRELRPLSVCASGRVYYVDGVGRVVTIDDGKLAVVDAGPVVASVATRGGLLSASSASGRRTMHFSSDEGSHVLTQGSALLQKPSTDFALVFGSNAGVVAYRRSSTWWTLLRHDTAERIGVPPAATVFGIFERGATALAVIDEGRHAIVAMTKSESTTVYRSAEPIDTAAVLNPDQVAFATASGSLAVYSRTHEGIVLRVGRPS